MSRQTLPLHEILVLDATPVHCWQRTSCGVFLAWSKTEKSMLILSYSEGAHLLIGSFCPIAQDQKVFLGGNHYMGCASTFPFANAPFSYTQDPGAVTTGHVVIENDVWIGRGCTIMSGVTIGSGSVVAANSVVTKTWHRIQ